MIQTHMSVNQSVQASELRSTFLSPHSQGGRLHSSKLSFTKTQYNTKSHIVIILLISIDLYLQRNTRYDALLQMNFTNGFRISLPTPLFGAIKYTNERQGKEIPMKVVTIIFQAMFRLRNPSNPSYHSVARSCWQFG